MLSFDAALMYVKSSIVISYIAPRNWFRAICL